MWARASACYAGLVPRFFVTVLLLLCLLAPAAARADETGGAIGLSLAPLIGTHTESGLETKPPIVPIPILEATGRFHRVELFAESLPGSPAINIGVDTQANDQLSTHLAFFDGVVRYYDASDRFWAGTGEIIYNQDTRYTQHFDFRDHITADASRVVGGRYEIGAGLFRNPERVRFFVDLMPALNGVISYEDNFYGRRGLASQPEHGAQFESNLAITNAHGPFAFRYGVRYVNYTARSPATVHSPTAIPGFSPT